VWGHDTRCEIPTEQKMDSVFILTSIVFSIKHMLNKLLKFMKGFKYFRFAAKQINSSKIAEIINKTDMIFLATKIIKGMAPNIREYKF
jgi:hypothetical protein